MTDPGVMIEPGKKLRSNVSIRIRIIFSRMLNPYMVKDPTRAHTGPGRFMKEARHTTHSARYNPTQKAEKISEKKRNDVINRYTVIKLSNLQNILMNFLK